MTLVPCCGMISVYRVWERQRRLIFLSGGGAPSCSHADLHHHYFPLFSLHSSSTELSDWRLPCLRIPLLASLLFFFVSLRLRLLTVPFLPIGRTILSYHIPYNKSEHYLYKATGNHDIQYPNKHHGIAGRGIPIPTQYPNKNHINVLRNPPVCHITFPL